MDGYTNSVLNIHQPLTHHLMDNVKSFISNQADAIVDDKIAKNNFFNNDNVKSFNRNQIIYPQLNQSKKKNPSHLEEGGVARSSWLESRERGVYKLQNRSSTVTHPTPNYFLVKNSGFIDKIHLPIEKQLQNEGNSNKAQKLKVKAFRFSPLQREKLEEEFERNNFLGRLELNNLAKSLKSTEKQVENWFRNRRAKQKRADSGKASRSPENSQLGDSKGNQEMETVIASNSIPKNPYWNKMSAPSYKTEEKNTPAVSEVVTKFLYQNEIQPDQVQHIMHNFSQYPLPVFPSYESYFSLPRIDYFGSQLTYNDYSYMYNPYYFDMNYYYKNPNFYHNATQDKNFVK